MTSNLRVFIISDEVLFSESLELALTLKSGINVLGIAHNEHEALNILEKTEADVALTDLNINGVVGTELIYRIKEIQPKIKILVLTALYDDKSIAKALQCGANAYVLKGSGVQKTIAAITNVMEDFGVIDEEIMKQLPRYINHHVPKIPAKSDFSGLTKRELNICDLIAKGYDSAQIAKLLFISKRTVNNNVSSIYTKTGISNRAQLVFEYLTGYAISATLMPGIPIYDDPPEDNRPRQKAILRLAGIKGLPETILLAIKERPFTIGRFDIGIGYKQCDFEFDPETIAVSRRHAAIKHSNSEYTIVDLNSSAGTFVNEDKIIPCEHHEIKHGDCISFGNAGANYIFEAV